jgi:hypothetical protein
MLRPASWRRGAEAEAFEAVGAPVVRGVLGGLNGAILAFGQA